MNGMLRITLRGENGSDDYELPGDVALEKLYPWLLAAVKKFGGDAYRSVDAVALASDYCILRDPTATLCSYGVKTGDCLKIIREKVL